MGPKRSSSSRRASSFSDGDLGERDGRRFVHAVPRVDRWFGLVSHAAPIAGEMTPPRHRSLRALTTAQAGGLRPTPWQTAVRVSAGIDLAFALVGRVATRPRYLRPRGRVETGV